MNTNITNCARCIAGAALALAAMAATADESADIIAQQMAEMKRQIIELQSQIGDNAALRKEVAELKTQNSKEVTELKAANGDKWLSEQRAAEIRGVVQEVLSDAESRVSLQSSVATSGYNNGFFISSPDGNFKLQLNGELQNRWAYNWLSSRTMSNSKVGGTIPSHGSTFNAGGVTKSAYGFEVRRAKLEFSGHVLDPSWQYAVTLAYQQWFSNNMPNLNANPIYQAGGGVNQGDNWAGGIGLENAYVKKNFDNGFSVQAGQFKSPLLREWLVSSKYQLAAERSLVETLFSTGWTQGIQANWNNDNMRVMASYNDGGNNANLGSASGVWDGGTYGSAPNNGNNGVGFASWAFTGRAEFMAFGNWAQFDQLTSMRGQATGLLLGAGMNWQRGGQTYMPTQTGSSVPANANADGEFLTWTMDATWQLGGANLYGAWVMNTAYSLPNGLSSINSYGLVLQSGYFINDAIEMFGRWEWMDIQNTGDNAAYANVSFNNASRAAVNNIGTIGANWYINKNVKFTTDVGISWNPVTFQTGLYGQNIAGADYRIEGASGGGQIVFRSQLQLLF